MLRGALRSSSLGLAELVAGGKLALGTICEEDVDVGIGGTKGACG